MLSKCLWSPTPLIDSQSSDVTFENAAILENIWDGAFRAGTIIFPSATDKSAPSPQRANVDSV